MTRTIRHLTLGLATAAALVATPAFAQKTGATPVVETEKAAKTAVNVDFTCGVVQVLSGNVECTTAYVVPVGMRLVIQDIHAYMATPQGEISSGFMAYSLDGQPAWVYLVPSASIGTATFVGRQVPTYVDGIEKVLLQRGVPGNRPGLTVTAYLVKK